MSSKIKAIEQLELIITRLKGEGKRIVLCHGVFDLLHIGHIRYFNAASKMGDILVVTLTEDRFVDKGPGRPAFPEELRAEAISNIGCVDFVAINKWPTAIETLNLLKPDLYVKGSDYKNASGDLTGNICLKPKQSAQVEERLHSQMR